MRRIGLIVLAVAIVLGGLAVFGLVGLTKGRNSANMAQVVVASRPIEFGQALTPSHLRLQTWPADAVPEGAFTQMAELTEGGQRVAIRAIAANEPILTSRISGAGGRATLSAQIAEGHRAVAIRVNDVVGVAGFVLPGDVVDVLLTRQEGQSYNNRQMRTDLLVESVRVLAVDQTASESRNDPQVARAVTIEVTPEEGQKIALASEIGTMSLALRRADDVAEESNDPASRTIRIEDLRAERDRATVVPTSAPAPRPRTRQAAPRQPAGPSVEVTRGFTTNRATVPAE